MPLNISPCRSLCDWRPTRTTYDDLPLFACAGCGGQWVRSEPWTPANADGTLPPGVSAERDAAAAGSADS